MNFYKTRSDLAREWSERTRQEYFGLVPYYVLGTIGDRNSVVARDLSGLRPVRGPGSSAPPASPPRPGPARPGGSLPATGLSDVVPAAALAAAAAGAAGLRRTASGPSETA